MAQCPQCGGRVVMGRHECIVTGATSVLPPRVPPVVRRPTVLPPTVGRAPERAVGDESSGRRSTIRSSSVPIPQTAPVGRGERSVRDKTMEISGTVSSYPQVSSDNGGFVTMLRPLSVILVIITLALTPGFLTAVVWLGAILLLFIWLLGRIGLFGPMMFLASRRPHLRRSARGDDRAILHFRVESAGRQSQVQLPGHDVGVALGDRVTVTGPRVHGVIHAVSVANETTGVSLRRPRLVRNGLLVAWDLYLAVVIIGMLS